MVKQPQENTDFHVSNSVDDNVTLYNQPIDDAFHSDLQLNAALKEGKSIFQIKDLLKPSGGKVATVSAVASTFSSNKGSAVHLTSCLPAGDGLKGSNSERTANSMQLSVARSVAGAVGENHHSMERKRDPIGKQQKKYDMIHLEMKQTHFYVHRDLLTENKNSQFETTFGDTSQTHFILDRDPKMFNQVLEYLRSNRESLPKDLSAEDKGVFQDELRYWGLQQNCSTEQTFHAEDSSDKFVLKNQSVQNEQTHPNCQMDEHQDFWGREVNQEQPWSLQFENQQHYPIGTIEPSTTLYGKALPTTATPFSTINTPAAPTGLPMVDQNLSGLQWQYSMAQEKLFQNQQLQMEFERRIEESNSIASGMIEPDLIQYVDHNNLQNIAFLSQLRQEAYGIMQNINYLKYQIDQAQLGVHRQQQQISESLPTPQTLMNNLCGNPLPGHRQIEGPKIEVEDLSSPKKIPDADKNYSNGHSTCQSEDKPKEATKEVPKLDLKKVATAPSSSTQDGSATTPVDEKPTPNTARVTPTAPLQKKAAVKKVSRSSKSVKKVKKRQPPQIRCGHPDKPHYSDGLCQKCYQKRFYQRKKLKQNGGTVINSSSNSQQQNPLAALEKEITW